MEKMYQSYKDVAEFRLIYITEAHAADSNWSVPYAVEKGIKEHTNYGERCQTAEMLMKDKKLTIPTLIDDMDDSVNKAYSAHPDRVFLVNSKGQLAIAGARGPWGFKPALDAAEDWLAEFKKTGKEPGIVEQIPPGRRRFRRRQQDDNDDPAKNEKTNQKENQSGGAKGGDGD